MSLLGGGDVVSLPRLESSPASRSRKSDHNSANDSLLLELLAISMGSFIPLNDGVEGVRLKGDIGIRRLLFDAPGRASPACSRCSVKVSVYVKGSTTVRRTIRPAQQRSNQLQCFELLRIRPVYRQEVNKVICNNLSVNVVFGSPLFQYSEGFRKMLVERYSFVP